MDLYRNIKLNESNYFHAIYLNTGIYWIKISNIENQYSREK